MDTEVSREQLLDVVERAVAELLQAARVAQPPVDAIAVAQQHLKIQVCLDRRQPQRGRAQRAGGRHQIYLRPEPTEERHQWTVAHEIGEHQKAALLVQLGLEPDETRPMMGESLANLFAFRLLVPTMWFATDAPACGYDLLGLKQRYRTASHEVIARRLLDLPEPCIITIIDNDSIHLRRSNSWRVRKQLEAAEQHCQRRVHQHGRPWKLQENGWTVQGWPVHQADWKREILRSVVDEG